MATGGAGIASSVAVAAAIAAVVVKQRIVANSPEQLAVAAQFAVAEAKFAVAVAQQSALAERGPLPDMPQRPDVPLQPGMQLPHMQQLPMQAHHALPRAVADVLPAVVVDMSAVAADMPAANASNLLRESSGSAKSGGGLCNRRRSKPAPPFCIGREPRS
jgi:hypothetical protein